MVIDFTIVSNREHKCSKTQRKEKRNVKKHTKGKNMLEKDTVGEPRREITCLSIYEKNTNKV